MQRDGTLSYQLLVILGFGRVKVGDKSIEIGRCFEIRSVLVQVKTDALLTTRDIEQFTVQRDSFDSG